MLDDGSAGDFPFGYESYYLDPDRARQLERRGPKPKKGLRVCEEEGRWVHQVFGWFLEGRSIAWIAKELTRRGVSKGRRASTPGWHHQQVRRILANEKYAGRWPWGTTTTVRNSEGCKKQVPTAPDERVVRDRPELRIIDAETWEKARRRLDELREQFGLKEGQNRRGPKQNPAGLYPRSLLGGVLVCGRCGANLWLRQSGQRRYYSCPGHDKGLCDLAVQVPADRAEQELTHFLANGLRDWPDWLGAVYQRTRELVQKAAARVPDQYREESERLAEVKRRITNLVTALADGAVISAAVRNTLAELEGDSERLQKRLEGFDSLRRDEAALPDDAWLAEQLQVWAAALNEDAPRAAALLRQAVGPVTVQPVVAPGKRRGYARLRFRIRAWEALRAVMGDRMSECWQAAANASEGELDASPEFVVDLGEPTDMDRWAPQIAAWRAQGVLWKEIVSRTGLDLNRAHIAWKRFTTSQSGGAGAS